MPSSIGGGFVAVEAADVTEAHRVARVRRDFVANVSHELKTPVGALQLLAEALLDATDATVGSAPDADPAEDVAAARRFAERIQHESTRLGRLVNELLELSRLQGAEPLPEPEPVAVDWIVAEVIDRTRTAAAAQDIEVRGRRRARADRVRQREPARHRGGEPGGERDRVLPGGDPGDHRDPPRRRRPSRSR